MSQTPAERPFDRETTGQTPPSSELDLYDKATRPASHDSYLQSLNLGLGYYDDQEYWQQVESYRNGLYASAAFGRPIIERAIQEAKNGLGREAWEDLSDDEKAEHDRRRYIHAKGEEEWEDLPTAAEDPGHRDQMDALELHAGITEAYTPLFWKLMEMKHDASRSRGARLIDNLLGRVKEFRGDGDQAPQGFLQRGGNR